MNRIPAEFADLDPADHSVASALLREEPDDEEPDDDEEDDREDDDDEDDEGDHDEDEDDGNPDGYSE